MRLEETDRDEPSTHGSGRSKHKHVRLDRPQTAADEPPAEKKTSPENRSLFDKILRAFKADNSDRRGARRHVAVVPEVWVGWWSGDEFGTVYGRLLNLSRGGALIVMGEWPPKNLPMWVYKNVGTAIACVRGEVVGATPAPYGAYAVRFRFSAPCPTMFCEAAVCEAVDRSGAAEV